MTRATISGFSLWQSSDFTWTAQVIALPEDFCEDYEGAGETPEQALGDLLGQMARDGKMPIAATYYPQRVTHSWPLNIDNPGG